MKKTPWFDSSEYPSRIGYYERRCRVWSYRKDRIDKVLYNGRVWTHYLCPGCHWRGLAKEPK